MIDLTHVTIGSVVFHDGLGEHMLGFDRESGRAIEFLRPRPEVAALEGLLAERVGSLAEFSDRRFARLRGLARDPATGRVLVVSDRVEGERLSEVLERARACGLIPDLAVALFVARQVLEALATFDRACQAAHGAIGLERVVLHPRGRIALADYPFAPVLERLEFSAEFLWRELHLAMPPGPEPIRFDGRADVAQVAVMLVELALGRRLAADEYPDRLPELAAEVREIADIRGGPALAEALSEWLDLALPGAAPNGFAGAAEAQAELEERLSTEAIAAGSRRDLREFLEQLAEAEAAERAELPLPRTAVSVQPGVVTSPLEAAAEPAAHEPGGADEVEIAHEELVAEEVAVEAEATPEPLTAAEPTGEALVVDEPIQDESVGDALRGEPAVAQTAGDEPLDACIVSPTVPDEVAVADALAAAEAVQVAEVPEAVDVPGAVEVPGASGTPFDFVVLPPGSAQADEPSIESPAALAETAAPAAPEPAEHEARRPGPPPGIEIGTAPPEAGPLLESPRSRLIADLDLSRLPEWMLEPDAEPEPRPPLVSPPVPPPAPAPPRAPTWTHVAEPAPEPVMNVRTEPPPGLAPPLVQPPAEEPVSERVERTKRFVQDLLTRRRERSRAAATLEPSAEPPWPTRVLSPSPRRSRVRLRRLATAAALLVPLGAAVAMGARWLAVRTQPGTLVVDSTPPGSEVLLDGERRGLTPLTLTVTPGAHTLELRWRQRTRTFSLDVAPGAEMTQTLDWGQMVDTGGLRVTSDPSGAQVIVDGRLRGQTPLALSELRVGRHTVVVRAETGTVTERVSVHAGETTTLDVLIYPGWLAVFAPVELQIFERGRRLGSSSDERIVVPPGPHEVELISEAYGYRATETLDVKPGAVASVSVEPKALVSLSATPWAHVFLDDEFLGETPLVNIPVTIGTREFVFRHPEYGERRVVAVVTLKTPVQISLDFTKH